MTFETYRSNLKTFRLVAVSSQDISSLVLICFQIVEHIQHRGVSLLRQHKFPLPVPHREIWLTPELLRQLCAAHRCAGVELDDSESLLAELIVGLLLYVPPQTPSIALV